MLDRTTRVVEGLVVYPEHLRANLDRTGGLWASEGILLALVDAGLGRQKAYELVQRQAMRAFHGEAPFRDLLLGDEQITEHLDAASIERQFDLDHAFAHVDGIIDRALSAAGGVTPHDGSGE
jgi:adenylosuccinate lyase